MRAAIGHLRALTAAGLSGWSFSAVALTACPEGTSEKPLVAGVVLLTFVAVASIAAVMIARRGLRAATVGLKIATVVGSIGAWLLIVGTGAATWLYLLLRCY